MMQTRLRAWLPPKFYALAEFVLLGCRIWPITMSDEGVMLIVRAALILVMIAVASICRVLAAPGRRGNAFLLAGTLGGITSGVAVASLASRLAGTDVSALTACLGMMAGWCAAAAWSRRAPGGA